MKNNALPALAFVVALWPLTVAAHHIHHYGHHRAYHHHASVETHPQISCEMVRSYVAQVGVAQARAMAQANGMTSSDEQRARRCLAHR
jgi:hypothetical protein